MSKNCNIALSLAIILSITTVSYAQTVGGTIMITPTKAAPAKKVEKPAAPPSSHKQTKIISIPIGDQKVQIHTFCVDPKGRLLCSCGDEQVVTRNTPDGFKAEIVKNEPGIRVVSPEGKLLDVWKVGFTPQTVNVGPDGFVYCGGAGKIAKLTMDGEVVKVIDSPNTKDMPPLPEIPKEIKMTESEMKEHAELKAKLQKQTKELFDEMIQLRNEVTKGVYEKIAEGKKKYFELYNKLREKDLPPEKRKKLQAEFAKVRTANSKLHKESSRMLSESKDYQQLKEKHLETYMKCREVSSPMLAAVYQRNLAMRNRRISGIAVNDKDVFICCKPPKGSAFQVWRGDQNLENFRMIVASLRGCCGNMDIQAFGDKLYAAENSRKKVVVFDRDGKKLAMWGDGKRGGKGLSFGSCCNPMNLRFDSGGNLLASESYTGIVKKFTPEGEFLGRVGKVELVPGCKHVAIGVADGGKRVYMLDITRSHIVLMEPVKAKGEKE